jgi:hypothetical protein
MKEQNQSESFFSPNLIPTDPIEERSFSLLRWAGYILLALSLIDYLAILIPLRLTDPVWEMQTIGQLVDHIWSVLLGLVFVFFHQKDYVTATEIFFLRYLSWASLIFGLLYLLMLPLGVNDSLQLYQRLTIQVNRQVDQRIEQITNLQQKITEINTPEQLTAIAKFINPQFNTQSNSDLEKLKQDLLQQTEIAQRQLSPTANKVKKEQTQRLIKQAVRVNFGALISGISLIVVWRLTNWTRILSRDYNL